jgi:hypothetical protein
MGFIAFKLFPNDVNSLDHPNVKEFKQMLDAMAIAYKCNLTSFAISHGVVMFHFDNEEITSDILKDMEDITGVKPQVFENKEKLTDALKEITEADDR